MKMIFTGKVSGEKTVLAAGARHTVKAQAGEQYGLVDEVTGLVPDGVEADRSGDDLILRKKEDSTEVRIEGFWEECQPGETQCTAVFNVVGENGQVTEAVLTQDGPVLENFTAGQSGTLAGGINNGIIWGGIAFGAGLAAIALAAGGGGGSSRHKRTAEEDGNGKPDDQDAALKQAQDLVAAAEGKQTEAENALTEANKDGAINQAEHDDLTGKNQAVTEAKTPAQAAVDALPDGQEKSELQNRLDAVDGITVPAVNDQDGNGKPDDQDAQEAFENAKVHVEKALNTVYQTNDDLYAKYAASFNKPAGNVDGSTTLWKPVLNKNNGAYFSSAKNAVGEFKYIYNGLNDTDIISTKYSIGGTGRSMTTRNDMDILTGEGDDIIAVGQDIGRSYSTGYTDKKYLTDMGDGNDILFVGLSNENVQINLRADGSLRAIKKGDYFTSGEIINVSGDYDSDSGGVISSTTIKMGNGDDTILALGWSDGGNAVQNSIIELGSGNDTMQVNGTIEASKIDGGAGFDTLIISNGTISSESFTGFEKIELMSSGHLVLHSKDFSNHDIGGILKVTGETGSSVNIQDFNWQQGRLGRIEEDGVSYTTYISAEYPDLSLWVQDGIDIR
ncbi:GA-like domain-containing protein [Escherichia coli]|uniref:GA-like domain-containing protein n=2 Tax=Escherichia coli TaxID=562 RepID=UPI001F335A61|nr:hypothetical protein [Escherichia coli]MCF3220293.1 hypothetical protein [Escherichia coli]MDE7951469.1 hypothetical protein [Escherichia coli]MDN4901853.1 hypothetical protein [Escherichia coli]HCQ0025691.1 hypothetical protein [Escherichia coli]HCU2491558.1 hypothetical protein [Escherichia coli]